ncbi:hypothetical protein ABGI61_00030 [Rheinheimera sp. FR7-31]|uniref:hypothetical protein n=1 Tax=Rheinheimera fenheensis TaxID=3152295 RepID=UPI00325C7896
MANKKIWSYAIDEEGNYVVGDRHLLKIYYIWEVLKLRREDIHQFNKLTFMSTHRAVEKRLPMTAVIHGFFRYKSAPDDHEKPEGDSDSLSHSIAIQALAELAVLNFKCGNEEFSIDVVDIRTEDTKVQLTNRDKFDYYYPDLICEFRSPNHLAMKWGKKLAIEVKHTHGCEDEKVHDFRNHCIPIIEVDIAKYSIEEKFGTKSPTPEQLEQYFKYWKTNFAKQIFGRILSDPVTPEYFNEFSRKALEKLSHFKIQSDKLGKDLTESRHKNSLLASDLEKVIRDYSSLCDEILKRDLEIKALESRGLKDYFLRCLGLKS